MTQTKERFDYIDELKGVAILLVVWGHCGSGNYFYNTLYYLHLPVFIIVTGMMLRHTGKWQQPGKYILKLVKSLMYPFVVFGLLSIVYGYWVRIAYGVGFSVSYRIKEIFCLGYDACWYLPALLIGEVVVILLVYACEKLMLKRYVLVVFLAAILAVAHMTHKILWKYYGEYNVDSFMGNGKMWLLLIVSRSLIFAVYLGVGYLLFPYMKKLVSFCGKKLAVISAVTFTVMVFVTGKMGFVDLRLVNWNNTAVYLGCSLLIALSMILFFASLNKKMRFLQYLGKNSLIIMGVHMSLRAVAVGNVVAYTICPASVIEMPTLFTIIVTIITMLVSIPWIPVFNKAFPFLLNFDELKGMVKGTFENRRG